MSASAPVAGMWLGVGVSTWSAVRATAAARSATTGEQRLAARVTGDGPALVATPVCRQPRLHRRRVAIGRWMMPRVPSAYVRCVEEALDRAGRGGPDELSSHLGDVGCAVAVALGVAPVAASIGAGWAGICIAIAGVAWFDSRLHAAGRIRRERLEAELPALLDTLSVVLGSGANLGAALDHVVAASSGVLSEELGRTLADVALGVALVESFAALAARTGSRSLRRLSDLFGQCRELGAPVAAATVELAAEMRSEAAHAGRRRAALLAPRISLVLSTVIVSGSLILVLKPRSRSVPGSTSAL